MSRKSPDIRLPCDQAQRTFFGGCGRNEHKADLTAVPTYANTTQQIDHTPPNAPRAPQGSLEDTTAPSCSETWDITCGDGANGYQYCGIVDEEKMVYTGATFEVGAESYNSYVATGTTANYADCEAWGQKSVVSAKHWQGRYSYSDRVNGQTDSMEWCCQCGYHGYDAAVPSTKYLSISAEYSYTQETDTYIGNSYENGTFACGDEMVDDFCTDYTFQKTDTITKTASSGMTMDRYGNRFVTACSSGSTVPASGDPDVDYENKAVYAAEAFLAVGDAELNISEVASLWCEAISSGGATVPEITGNENNFHAEWNDLELVCYDQCGNETSRQSNLTRMTVDVNLSAGTFVVKTWGLKYDKGGCSSDGSCPTYVQLSTESWTFAGTSMSHIYDAKSFGSESVDSRTNYSLVGTLSSPYSISEVQATCKELLSYWDMGNDVLLPWRASTDNNAPLVSYDEGGGFPTLGSCTNDAPYSGRIMGKPGPAGIDWIFNKSQKVWDVCTGVDGCTTKYIYRWGEYSTVAGIPSATQWLDKWTKMQLPTGCAFIGWNFFTATPTLQSQGGVACDNWDNVVTLADDRLLMRKYAETIIPSRRSFNYARPCGIDRFQVESTECVESATDNVLTLESSTAITTGQLVWVCGVDGVESGVWTATKNSDTEIALSNCIVTASFLPEVPIEDCGTGMVGPLRWQTLKPAICGRIDITSVTPTAPAIITLAEPAYFANTDTVTVTGAVGANINGTFGIEIVDASNIILVGSDATGASYEGSSGAVYSPGAADYRWNDNAPKGDYHRLEWKFNYRPSGEYNRIADLNTTWTEPGNSCDGGACSAIPNGAYADEQTNYVSETKCQNFNPCSPIVAYWSPTTENFSGASVNYGWTTVTPDSEWGGIYWAAMVRQTQTDPLWQAPPEPCGWEGDELDTAWSEDDGTCKDISNYPYRQQVEARAEAYPGAPTLAAGTIGGTFSAPSYGWDQSDLESYEPTISYVPYYVIYNNEKVCVCGNGETNDWTTIYNTRDGVACGPISPAP